MSDINVPIEVRPTEMDQLHEFFTKQSAYSESNELAIDTMHDELQRWNGEKMSQSHDWWEECIEHLVSLWDDEGEGLRPRWLARKLSKRLTRKVEDLNVGDE